MSKKKSRNSKRVYGKHKARNVGCIGHLSTSFTIEQEEFLAAIESFKCESGKNYLAWTDVLLVVKLLGYKKIETTRDKQVMALILTTVCTVLDVEEGLVWKTHRKTPGITLVRKFFCYLVLLSTNLTCKEIGEFIGRSRDSVKQYVSIAKKTVEEGTMGTGHQRIVYFSSHGRKEGSHASAFDETLGRIVRMTRTGVGVEYRANDEI